MRLVLVQSSLKYYLVVSFAFIIATSFETPLAIITPINITNVNPTRIIVRAKFPNQLIKFQVLPNIVKELSVCNTVEYVAVKIECASLHVLATLCPTDCTVEIRVAIA